MMVTQSSDMPGLALYKLLSIAFSETVYVARPVQIQGIGKKYILLHDVKAENCGHLL